MVLRFGVLPAVLLLSVVVGAQADERPGALDHTGDSARGTPGSVLAALLPLPDDGPRDKNIGEEPEPFLLQRGVEAFRRGDYDTAVEQIRAFLREKPNSPAIPAALAFLADATIAREPSSHGRTVAIDIYRAIAREYTGTANASRAEWRIGDLYVDQGLYYEAQAAYERALARAQSSFDTERSMLGLGLTLMALHKWREAEQTLETLRRRTTDASALMRVMLALATTLYEQNRLIEAQPLFEACHERWPALMKRDPESLLRFAATLSATGRRQSARNVLVEFYNLYPAHREATSALVRVGDLFFQSELRRHAELFYAWALTAHPGSPGEPVAKMRLVQLGQVQSIDTRGLTSLHVLVGASMRGMPGLYFDPEEQRRILQDLISRYGDSPLGSEAQFRLGEHFELARDWPAAAHAYRMAVERAGQIEQDPWPEAAALRISAILRSWMAAALAAGDDLTAVALFHRHGRLATHVYRGHELLLRIADAHRRLGFTSEAVRLYQAAVREPEAKPFLEEALIGLGKSYLAQQDPSAAKKVFERYRFQFPLGRYAREVLHLLLEAMHRENDRDGVIRLCREWLKRHHDHPDRPRMLGVLATTLADAGRVDEALPIYDEAWRAGALQSASSLLRFGDMLIAGRQYDRAATVLRQVLAMQPEADEMPWVRLQLGRIALTQGRYAEAGALLDQAGKSVDQMVRRVAMAMRRQLPPEKEPKGG